MTRSLWILMLTAMLVAPAFAQDEAAPADGGGTAIGSDDPSGGAVVPAGDAPAGETPAGEAPAEGDKPADKPAGDDKKPGMDWTFPAIIIGVLVLMFFMSSRSKRKQESKHREMVAALGKGDKVTSIGGICGTVVDTRDDEIVVKIDENTRMRFAPWAIRNIGGAKGEAVQDEKK